MSMQENTVRASSIPGLRYLPGYIDQTAHDALVKAIESHGWQRAERMKRLVQQYGYAYNHGDQGKRPVRAEPFPAWLDALATRLRDDRHFVRKPDQAIINRYQPGEGIGPHVDYTTHFGPTVASLSLLSDVVMDFIRIGNLTDEVPVLLERGSAVILSRDARLRWKHGIASRRIDTIEGRDFIRSMRYSITFRTMS